MSTIWVPSPLTVFVSVGLRGRGTYSMYGVARVMFSLDGTGGGGLPLVEGAKHMLKRSISILPVTSGEF
jgi:hypothetical protein